MNFLIADDNQINRQFLHAVLSGPGHQVSEASNGHEAIARCREQQFDLVFMDIRMPELDGIEATRKIRQLADHDPQRTCIVALTADLQLKLQDRLLADGFNACLTKPISRNLLLETVERVQSGLCPEGETALVDTRCDAPIDQERALAATGGSRELLEKLTAMFVLELQQLLLTINTAIEASDPDAARDCAHKLRASAGYCGALQVQQAAAELETAIVSGAHGKTRPAAEKLQLESDRLLSYLGED